MHLRITGLFLLAVPANAVAQQPAAADVVRAADDAFGRRIGVEEVGLYSESEVRGFSLQSGLGIAKFAATMYLSVMPGAQMFARLNGLGLSSFGGMGMLGNPALFQMQMGGLGGLGKGAGIDATAGAASFLMQQAVTMNELGGFVGVPGQGPSYDESLGEAIQNATKGVQKALQK